MPLPPLDGGPVCTPPVGVVPTPPSGFWVPPSVPEATPPWVTTGMNGSADHDARRPRTTEGERDHHRTRRGGATERDHAEPPGPPRLHDGRNSCSGGGRGRGLGILVLGSGQPDRHDGSGRVGGPSGPRRRRRTRVQAMAPPLELRDARPSGKRSPRRKHLAEGRRVLLHTLDPLGAVDRAEPAEPGRERHGGGQGRPDLRGLDANGARDRHHGGRPDDHEPGIGHDLGRDLHRADADHVVEHDDVGLFVGQDAGELGRRGRVTDDVEPVAFEHGAKGSRSIEIRLPDDDANVALSHPTPVLGPSPSSDRPQGTRGPVAHLQSFVSCFIGIRNEGR